jgi:hypothetical protein
MPKPPVPLDLKKVNVFPLATRKRMARVEDILVNPATPPPALANYGLNSHEYSARRLGFFLRHLA